MEDAPVAPRALLHARVALPAVERVTAQAQRHFQVVHGQGALQLGRELGPGAVIICNLSGRGDKDVATAAKWFGLLDDEAAQ